MTRFEGFGISDGWFGQSSETQALWMALGLWVCKLYGLNTLQKSYVVDMLHVLLRLVYTTPKWESARGSYRQWISFKGSASRSLNKGCICIEMRCAVMVLALDMPRLRGVWILVISGTHGLICIIFMRQGAEWLERMWKKEKKSHYALTRNIAAQTPLTRSRRQTTWVCYEYQIDFRYRVNQCTKNHREWGDFSTRVASLYPRKRESWSGFRSRRVRIYYRFL